MQHRENQIFNGEKVAGFDGIKWSALEDEWSSMKNKGLVNFVVTCSGSILMATIDTSGHSYLTEFIGEKIEEIGEKVIALVTENAAVMKQACEIIKI